MKIRLPLAGLSLLCGLGLAPTLAAQGLIHQWFGDARYDGLGRAVTDVGDIDGDGYAEVFAGAPLNDVTGSDAGLARLYNGDTGFQMWEWDGQAGQDQLGFALSGAGDVNGDGTPDLMVASPRADFSGQGAGRVRVYSGRGWSQLYTLDGRASKDLYGTSVSDLGDVDFDGFDDFAIGALQWEDGLFPGPGNGYVEVYSGRSGSLLYSFDGAKANDWLGASVAGPGDVNLDGYNDILVGAYGMDINGNKSGSVMLYSGLDGSVIYQFNGDAQGDKLGISVHAAGDVNNDGYPDMIAGAHNSDVNASNAGMARVYSGIDGSTLYTWYGSNAEDLFGMSVGGGADIDGDGYDDLVVGVRHDDTVGDNSGKVITYSGQTGAEIWTAYGLAEHDLYGFAVSMAGDVNGDGVEDIVVGGSQYNDGPGPGNGIVQVLDPTTGPPPPPPPYPNLPTTFLAIGTGITDNFDSYNGIVPSHFGTNGLDALSRLDDPDGWCNIGQNGPNTGGISGVGPFSGSFDLEIGSRPGSTKNSATANALIIGLDGGGSTDFDLEYQVYNFGDENDNEDGVWVSTDGIIWERVGNGWSNRPVDAWTKVTGVSLGSTNVDISGQFYLCIAQTDNLPLGEADGVLVDDLSIAPAAAGYRMTQITPGVTGISNTVEIEGGTPGQDSTFAYGFVTGSFSVPGCPGLSVELAFPNLIASVPADALGHAEVSSFVPAAVSGRTVYLQAVELSTCQKTNMLAHTFP
jgi:FG-GAP repeat protein